MSDVLQKSTLRQPAQWVWGLFLALLAFAPGSSKVAGAIWFLLVGAAVWAWWFVPKADKLTSEESDLLLFSRRWLAFCLAAFAFKAVGMFYWGDPWWTRHFEFRILCAAFAMPILLARFRLSPAQKGHVASALLIASMVALVVAYRFAYHAIDTPSQRINWAGGLVMLACIVLPLVKLRVLSRAQQWAMAAATLVFVLAVLLTGSRGPYLALPWVVVGSLYLLGGNLRALLTTNKTGRRWLVGAGALLIALPMVLPKVFEVPSERVRLGLSEMRAMVSAGHRSNKAIDTSVGTRVYMWQRSKEKIAESPWIGYGREQRMGFIQEWGVEVDAEKVTDQTHMHSEYVNGLIDHGVFGLLSTLSLMVGVALLALQLRRRFPLAAFSVGGIAFTHFVMSFTDTNSQTNNYSVMISVSLLLALMLASTNFEGAPPAEAGESSGAP